MSWDKSKDELREEFSRQVNKRKPTAKWCKGKVGREHVTEIVVNHNYSSTRDCRWGAIYFSFARRAEGPKDYRYWCRHSRKCTACGKYVEYFLKDEDCPSYTPKPA